MLNNEYNYFKEENEFKLTKEELLEFNGIGVAGVINVDDGGAVARDRHRFFRFVGVQGKAFVSFS